LLAFGYSSLCALCPGPATRISQIVPKTLMIISDPKVSICPIFIFSKVKANRNAVYILSWSEWFLHLFPPMTLTL
jgi:hypothetical protein